MVGSKTGITRPWLEKGLLLLLKRTFTVLTDA